MGSWGRRRNPSDWSFVSVPAATITDRGFTGHEHLDEFRLINMGGRLFDPLTSRFLNSDPVIDSRGTAQGLNSYTYCLNNPLKYTDPTGYILDGPMEEITYQNPGWLRYAGGGHSSSSWFENQMMSGHGGEGSEGSGGGCYGKPGEGDNGLGTYGIYYDAISKTYRYVNNPDKEVPLEEVMVILAMITSPTQNTTNQGDIGSDGLSIREAVWHYNYGGKKPVDVPLNTIDFSKLKVSDFPSSGTMDVNLGNKYRTNWTDAIVHGTIALDLIPGTNQVRINPNSDTMFDFDMKNWNTHAIRNLETIILKLFIWAPISVITGGAYNINYTGTATIDW